MVNEAEIVPVWDSEQRTPSTDFVMQTRGQQPVWWGCPANLSETACWQAMWPWHGQGSSYDLETYTGTPWDHRALLKS